MLVTEGGEDNERKKKIETESSSGQVSRAIMPASEGSSDGPAEHPPATSTGDDACQDWINEFFDEQNIIHTMQCLLRNGGRTIEDLCKLCVDASASDIVAALTPEGLMPFSNNYGYVFKYEHMTKKQIRALLAIVESMAAQNRMMRCVHENNFYIVPLNKNFVKIRDEVLVFGATAFMCNGLTYTHIQWDGAASTHKLPESERERLINAAMFRIINSCAMKRGVLREAMAMLHARNICV